MGEIIIKSWHEDIWLKILTLSSIILIFIGMFCPPMGVIDGSVLIAVGELTGLGALWQLAECINKNIDAKIKIKQVEMEIHKDKNTENE